MLDRAKARMDRETNCSRSLLLPSWRCQEGTSRQRPPLGRRPKIPERSGSKSSTLNIPELTSMLMLGRWHMPSGKRSVGLQGFGNNFAIASQLYQLSDQPANKALILSRMLDSCGRKVKSDRHNGAM